mgnify:CR=1 FL=1
MRDERLSILGDNIRAERMRKRFSQESLAELANISKESLHKIENGRQTPSAFIVFDIANALNIPLDDLFKNVPSSKD